MHRLPDNVFRKLRETEEHTANNTAMTMVVALSYSSRWEIVNAMQEIMQMRDMGESSYMDWKYIDEQMISKHLQTRFMPDPDLLIRTGGELRISNFLLWQIAYAELYFTDVKWPDFSREELLRALRDYAGRDRRFGGLKTDGVK
jgi:undecaprenyl diphosphate synthase